jgi:hypothetical protein
MFVFCPEYTSKKKKLVFEKEIHATFYIDNMLIVNDLKTSVLYDYLTYSVQYVYF